MFLYMSIFSVFIWCINFPRIFVHYVRFQSRPSVFPTKSQVQPLISVFLLRRVDRADIHTDITVPAFRVVYRELALGAYYYRVEGALHVAGSAADADTAVYIVLHISYPP